MRLEFEHILAILSFVKIIIIIQSMFVGQFSKGREYEHMQQRQTRLSVSRESRETFESQSGEDMFVKFSGKTCDIVTIL